MDEQELKAIGRVIEENNNWRARYTQLHEQFDDLKAERAALLAVLVAGEAFVVTCEVEEYDYESSNGQWYPQIEYDFDQDKLAAFKQAIEEARALVGSGGEEGNESE